MYECLPPNPRGRRIYTNVYMEACFYQLLGYRVVEFMIPPRKVLG